MIFGGIQRTSTIDFPGVLACVLFTRGCDADCFYCHNRDLLSSEGETVEEAEVLRFLERRRGLLDGVVVSGGEPLLQAEALADTLCLLKQKHIATCVDTAGDVAWEHMERAAQYCDLFLYDIKAFDAALHKKITGADNGRILDNAGRLAAMHKPMWIRMVIVKGYNDDRRDLRKRLQFVASLGSAVQRVELLPYHALGEGKYKSMELAYPIQEDACPDAETLAYCMEEGRRLNLPMYMEKA